MSQFAKCLVLFALFAASSAQLSGSASSNPAGGQDVTLKLGHAIGDPSSGMLSGGAFTSGNTMTGQGPSGLFLNADKNGHGVGLQHTQIPNFGSTFQQNAHANLFNNDKHNLNANAFHERTNHVSGLKFNRIGTGLQYDHAAGHGASVGVSRIPQFDMNTLNLNGRANLFQSQDRATRLDLNAGASKALNGGGPWNKNIGLGVTHFFG